MQLTDRYGRWVRFNYCHTAGDPSPGQVIESDVLDLPGHAGHAGPKGRCGYVTSYRLYREWLQGNIDYGKHRYIPGA